MPKNPVAISRVPDLIVKATDDKVEISAPEITVEVTEVEVAPAEVPTTVSPYKLRAIQDTTFMKFDENKKLIYSDIYKRGQEVSNPQKVIDILASQQHNHFRKINLGAD